MLARTGRARGRVIGGGTPLVSVCALTLPSPGLASFSGATWQQLPGGLLVQDLNCCGSGHCYGVGLILAWGLFHVADAAPPCSVEIGATAFPF